MKVHFALVALLACATAGAQTAPPPPAAAEANPDVTVDSFTRNERFNDDGTSVALIEVRARPRTDAGVKELGVIVLPYDSDREQISDVRVSVRKPDGSAVATKADAVQEMMPSVEGRVTSQTSLREKHIPVAGLQPGDTLEYAFHTRVTKPFAPGQFWDEVTMPSNFLRSDITVDLPASRAVKIKWAEGWSPDVKESNGRRIYHVVHQGSGKPADAGESQRPALQLSTFADWDAVGKWTAGNYAAAEAISPEIRRKAAELARPDDPLRKRAEAIYFFVDSSVRTMPLLMVQPRPRDADQVLKDGYGTVQDKHALLQAMLTAAGFKPESVLVHVQEDFDGDIPSPQHFGHIVTVLPEAGEEHWLDPSVELAPFGYLVPVLRGKSGLRIGGAASRLVTTPSQLPFPTRLDIVVQGMFNDKGELDARIELTVRGDSEVDIRQGFRLAGQSRWTELLQSVSGSLGFSGTVSDVTASDPADLSRAFHVAFKAHSAPMIDWLKNRGKFVLLLPSVQSVPAATPQEKPGPIKLKAEELSLSADLEFPAGVKPQALSPVEIHRDFADYAAKYEVSGSTLKIRRTRVQKVIEMPRERYVEFNGLRDSILKDEAREIQYSGFPPFVMPNLPPVTAKSPLLDQAIRAADMGEVMKAEGLLKQVLAADPKNASAWYELGRIHVMTRRNEQALTELKKAIALDEFDQEALKQYAMTNWRLGNYPETESSLRKLLELAPLDAGYRMNLGEILVLEGRPKEGVPFLETSTSQDPKNAWARMKLTEAYLLAGDSEKGTRALADLVRDSPGPVMVAKAASLLADAGLDLDGAQQYAEDGLRMIAPVLQGAETTGPDPMLTSARNTLPFLWSAMGWVAFKKGQNDRAQAFLKASWTLSQSAEAGDRYAQVLIKNGRSAEAARVLADCVAGSKLIPAQSEIASRERLEKLVGKVRARQLIASGQKHLQDMRTFHLGPAGGQSGSSDWIVVFKPDGSRIARFASGNEALRSLKPAIEAAKFDLVVPPGTAIPATLRGVLSCSSYTGCMFVLIQETPVPIQPAISLVTR